jgi:hypothetical protein
MSLWINFAAVLILCSAFVIMTILVIVSFFMERSLIKSVLREENDFVKKYIDFYSSVSIRRQFYTLMDEKRYKEFCNKKLATKYKNMRKLSYIYWPLFILGIVSLIYIWFSK